MNRPVVRRVGSECIDLVIAGAQKAGTTSLFRYLGNHPSVTAHPQREFNYFLSDDQYATGWSDAKEKFFGASSGREVILAKHVMLMYSEKALVRLKEHNDDVRIVVCLREPVARAHSAYWYARRRGWETIESFRKALKAEKERIDTDGWEAWRQCAYRTNSKYLPHIERLFDLFPRDQVDIVLTEDLTTSRSAVCTRILESVGLDLVPGMNLDTRHNTARRVRNEWLAQLIAKVLRRDSWFKKTLRPLIPDSVAHRARHAAYALNEEPGRPPEIDPFTANMLAAEFADDHERLAHLIDRDLSSWSVGDMSAVQESEDSRTDPPDG